ncbi:MAG: oxidoreductase [Candidatus Doudnabacteria bacterium RIFCSPLOWO2_02_FULL_48_13]|uniref:Oxidoreductase n=1 Tax=Candidatus Doudnabacteria bacterium RIFCSPLOWO2_02_FULL_48_13 TaxID=1817845 RepID=A0A1F5QAW4_9BACT|nr:MAG: oxidoreductase [Candidatus Doudnabacteria bacterium RIFCSPLOWO2_02_FULL_48_13]
MKKSTLVSKMFDMKGRVAVITGAAGLLGPKHAESLAEFGANIVLLDRKPAVQKIAAAIARKYKVKAIGLKCDITQKSELEKTLKIILKKFGHIDVLVNNAANNPAVSAGGFSQNWSRLENFPLSAWEDDVAVGLTGAFLASQVFGSQMATQKKGVIVNIASDLGIIAPDQRIYRKEGLPPEQQSVKPVTYSVIKHGMLGLTKYLASYWAESGVRVNAISPGGVYTNQPRDFVKKLARHVPLHRMAHTDEYKAAIAFLSSDASEYMTGANLVVDGGRTIW